MRTRLYNDEAWQTKPRNIADVMRKVCWIIFAMNRTAIKGLLCGTRRSIRIIGLGHVKYYNKDYYAHGIVAAVQ